MGTHRSAIDASATAPAIREIVPDSIHDNRPDSQTFHDTTHSREPQEIKRQIDVDRLSPAGSIDIFSL